MSHRFAIFALLFSSSAFACPNLTGTYNCPAQKKGQTYSLTISQEQDKSGVTAYTINSSTLLADNKAYPIPDSEQLKNGTFKAWCDTANTSNVLNTEITGKIYSEGEFYADLTLTTAYTVIGSDLTATSTGSLTNTGGSHPLKNEQDCTRAP